MSLYRYRIDFSALSMEERSALMDRIDAYSFTGLQIADGFQSGQFFLDEHQDPAVLDIPDGCYLTRLYSQVQKNNNLH